MSTEKIVTGNNDERSRITSYNVCYTKLLRILALPGGGLIPFSHIELASASLLLVAPAMALARWLNHNQLLRNTS